MAFEQISSELVYEGRIIQVRVDTYKTESGAICKRDVVGHPGAVAIIPMIDHQTVCLIRNHRLAVAETLLELPAGTREPNETPEETAIRELAEETGYRTGSLRKLIDFFPSPGVLAERMHLFVAEDLEAGPADLEPGEMITTEVMSWTDALAQVDDGGIRDGKTVIGLLHYDRARNRDL